MSEATYRRAEAEVLGAYGTNAEERWVDFEGATVRVLTVGRGEPVLMVHGSPNTAITWVPLAAKLPGRQCLLVERPGAGLSGPVRWTNHRAQSAALLERVLDSMGHESADVIASSFGGLYAYNLALAAPRRVRHLVQMGCPLTPGHIDMPGIFRLLSLPLLPSLIGAGMRPDAKEAKKMWTEIGHGAAIEKGLLPDCLFSWYSALLCETRTLGNLVDEVRALATPFGYRASALLSAEELRAMKPPLLYLWGTEDNFGSTQEGERLAAMTPGAKMEVLPTFGHLPWVDDPERIAKQVASFLADSPAFARAG